MVVTVLSILSGSKRIMRFEITTIILDYSR
nr:MAG TPA: hypothetical protein [Caudoviricetes sp.]DAK96446.1 MAG TPA: hypothetical protein [Caudoviricetes sp.]